MPGRSSSASSSVSFVRVPPARSSSRGRAACRPAPRGVPRCPSRRPFPPSAPTCRAAARGRAPGRATASRRATRSRYRGSARRNQEKRADGHRGDGIDTHMAGETRRAVAAQPDWLRRVPTDKRLPDEAVVVHTGCGTSFHAAQTGGWAVQALEAVLRPPRADIMVCVSHEGGTALTMEAERMFGGDVLARHRQPGLRVRRARRRGDRVYPGDRAVVVPHRELHVGGRGDRCAAR